MVSPGLTGAGGFNPHKRTPQQASTQQAVQGKSEPTDSPNQSQQIPGTVTLLHKFICEY